MSQHALSLAEEFRRFMVAVQDHDYVDCGIDYANDCPTCRAFDRANEMVALYEISDEHTIDVQRARASAAGFQGLAGDPSEKVTK